MPNRKRTSPKGVPERARSDDVLSRRALNRATLARQLLLERSKLSVPEALTHLVGLQAQTPTSWYVGLWTRLEEAPAQRVADLLTGRQIVRIALLRSTIHLVTAHDCLALRPHMEPVLARALGGNFGRRLAGIDEEALIAAGRELVDAQPRTFDELGKHLQQRWPDRDAAALAQGIRAWVPLVQVPPRGIWGASGLARHTSAQAWLGRQRVAKLSREDLIRRYLAAFGPASVKDMQTWSGLTRLAEVIKRLAPRLITFRDEQGRELFDLPDAPRPDPDTPAPPRFMYDNLYLSHADRSRMISGEIIPQLATKHGPVYSTMLVDGFVGGTWQIARARNSATLTMHPFSHLAKKDAAAWRDEARRLLSFAAADTDNHEVRIEPS